MSQRPRSYSVTSRLADRDNSPISARTLGGASHLFGTYECSGTASLGALNYFLGSMKRDAYRSLA